MKALKHISDTAYLVAAYRAFETERADSLFKDPYAKQLVGQHGFDVVSELRDGRNSSWFLVARTLILDQWILDLIHQEELDTVINLAAGLDTRAFRLPLPRHLTWYDVDLSDITLHKEKNLVGIKPTCIHHFVPLDLSNKEKRTDFFKKVAGSSKKALILSEGFLMYLNPSQAAELATDLSQYPPFRFWLAELIGPIQLKLIQWKWGKAFREANSEMRFAPREGADFFKAYGWTPKRFVSSFDKAIEIKRAPSGAKTLRMIFSFLPSALNQRINRAGIALLANKM